MEGIQHSATFHPGQDDYDSPYGTWDDTEIVTTPPRISSPEQRQFHARSPVTQGYSGVAGSPGISARPSPLMDSVIYTPSTGSSPSASSPPRADINPAQYSPGVGTSYTGRASVPGPKIEKMQPLFEDEALETKERQPSGYGDTLGYVRRAATTVKRKFSRRYRPVRAEDPEQKDLTRARALQDEESRAASEGYGNIPGESFICIY